MIGNKTEKRKFVIAGIILAVITACFIASVISTNDYTVDLVAIHIIFAVSIVAWAMFLSNHEANAKRAIKRLNVLTTVLYIEVIIWMFMHFAFDIEKLRLTTVLFFMMLGSIVNFAYNLCKIHKKKLTYILFSVIKKKGLREKLSFLSVDELRCFLAGDVDTVLKSTEGYDEKFINPDWEKAVISRVHQELTKSKNNDALINPYDLASWIALAMLRSDVPNVYYSSIFKCVYNAIKKILVENRKCYICYEKHGESNFVYDMTWVGIKKEMKNDYKSDMYRFLLYNACYMQEGYDRECWLSNELERIDNLF